jgi:hypothetical protein
MSQIAVQTAFDLRMQAFAAGTLKAAHKADLQLGETVYAVKPGTPYYSARLSAYTSEPLGVGPNAVVRERGIYQIGVHRPAAEGSRTALLIAADLVAHFGRGAVISPVPGGAEQLPINVEFATDNPPVSSDGWITVPVMVRWFTCA